MRLRRAQLGQSVAGCGVVAVTMLALVSANLDTIFYRIVQRPQ